MPRRARHFGAFLWIFLLLVSLSAPQLFAQQGGVLEPPTTGGLAVLLQELRMLGHQKRVLMIGAHPDDEDTELLVLLTRHEGAEAGYLSLTRGEGGQNLIGSELGPALGILRTEELLSARRIDGAQQFFSRAYDFGFSKTLDDTWAHWPTDSVLKDVVRIIRRFRPQVVVAVFSGTPRDGHGQHQAFSGNDQPHGIPPRVSTRSAECVSSGAEHDDGMLFVGQNTLFCILCRQTLG